MTHKEYADGLRQIADFLEAHPEIDLPEARLTNYSLDKSKAPLVARAMGKAEKVWADTLFTLRRNFGEITLEYHGLRSNICERVIVGKTHVPEVHVPARIAEEAHTVPAHEEPVYEWRCSPVLGKPTVESDETPELVAPVPLQLEAENVPF